MPEVFKEDFFERVVDVQWRKRGAIFVAGDVCCFNWWIKAQKKGGKSLIRFQPIGTLGFTDKGASEGAAYGAVGKDKKNKIKGSPTFCLGGGHSEGTGDSGVNINQIFTSADGVSWGETYNKTTPRNEPTASMTGGSWDGRQFTIGEHTSPTGYGWSEGGGGGRRDDLGGRNEKGEYHSAGEFGADYLVYAGGVWCKATGQNIEVSLDDLDSWEMAGSTTQYDVTCLAGGALEDFPKDMQ
jgi:hypothetical protein